MIERRTPIARSTKQIRRTALKRSTTELKRTPVKRVRSKVRDSRLQQFHEATALRCGGKCEAKFSPECTGRFDEAHHVVPRGRGAGWVWLNDPSRNGISCCQKCHDRIHRPPREDAKLPRALGLLRSRPATDADPGPILPQIEAAR